MNALAKLIQTGEKAANVKEFESIVNKLKETMSMYDMCSTTVDVAGGKIPYGKYTLIELCEYFRRGKYHFVLFVPLSEELRKEGGRGVAELWPLHKFPIRPSSIPTVVGSLLSYCKTMSKDGKRYDHDLCFQTYDELPDDDYTMLHTCASQGYTRACHQIMQTVKECDGMEGLYKLLSTKNKSGDTAFHVAAKFPCNHKHVTSILTKFVRDFAAHTKDVCKQERGTYDEEFLECLRTPNSVGKSAVDRTIYAWRACPVKYIGPFISKLQCSLVSEEDCEEKKLLNTYK